VERVVHYLHGLGYPEVTTTGGIQENVKFSLPAELAQAGRDLTPAALNRKERFR